MYLGGDAAQITPSGLQRFQLRAATRKGRPVDCASANLRAVVRVGGSLIQEDRLN